MVTAFIVLTFVILIFIGVFCFLYTVEKNKATLLTRDNDNQAEKIKKLKEQVLNYEDDIKQLEEKISLLEKSKDKKPENPYDIVDEMLR